jgi:sn1-specific diacylglycerol lipase
MDYFLTGRNNGTGLVLGLAVSSAFGIAESIAIGSIILGERIASATFETAYDSVNLLSGLFENDEASFSLAAFGQLVRREWNNPVMAEHLPEKRYNLSSMIQALMAWAAIQKVTQFHTEIQWFQFIRELSKDELEGDLYPTSIASFKGGESVHVTDDTLLPETSGQIVSAEIGQASNQGIMKAPSRSRLLPTLRRLSKLVMAGYGGVGMIFFGVPLTRTNKEENDRIPSPEALRSREESIVKEVVESLEIEEKRSSDSNVKESATKNFSWWKVLLGTIFSN